MAQWLSSHLSTPQSGWPAQHRRIVFHRTFRKKTPSKFERTSCSRTFGRPILEHSIDLFWNIPSTDSHSRTFGRPILEHSIDPFCRPSHRPSRRPSHLHRTFLQASHRTFHRTSLPTADDILVHSVEHILEVRDFPLALGSIVRSVRVAHLFASHETFV